MKRREFFKTAGIGSASLVTLSTLADALVNPALAGDRVELNGEPGNTFTILLAGLYKPVAHCPDLGLSTVNVCDGTYAVNNIYPVSGLPLGDQGDAAHGNRSSNVGCQSPIGRFYVSNDCAYDLPSGTIAMIFTGSKVVAVSDRQGGTYNVGTIELDITEATGVYKSFVGGHNTMVDIFRTLADGSSVEDCYCNISRP
jgi:hypothetical protein